MEYGYPIPVCPQAPMQQTPYDASNYYAQQQPHSAIPDGYWKQPYDNYMYQQHHQPQEQHQQLLHIQNAQCQNPQPQAEMRPRRRISKQQACLLERTFNENPKPSRLLRQDLSDALGISVKNVQIWFQNRRQKAKLAKRSVEQRTREALEEASQRTAAEHAQMYSLPVAPDTPQQQSHVQQSPDATPSTPRLLPKTPTTNTGNSTEVQSSGHGSGSSSVGTFGRPRAYTTSSVDTTPTQANTNRRQMSTGGFSSPHEASYASLARSLAVAAAAAEGHNKDVIGDNSESSSDASPPASAGIRRLGHNPFFDKSAFGPAMARNMSEGASTATTSSSVVGTPGSLNTPIKFGPGGLMGVTPSVMTPSNTENPSAAVAQFSEFRSAIQRRLDSYAVNVSGEPSANKYKHPTNLEVPERPSFSRQNSCPDYFVDAFHSVDIRSPTEQVPPTEHVNESESGQHQHQLSSSAISHSALNARRSMKRRRPQLSPLGIGMQRSKSSLGECLSAGPYTSNYGALSAGPNTFDRRNLTPMAQRSLSFSATVAPFAQRSAPTSPIDRSTFGNKQDNSRANDSPSTNPSLLSSSANVRRGSVHAPPTPLSPLKTTVANADVEHTPINGHKPDVTLRISKTGDAFVELVSPPMTPYNSAQMHYPDGRHLNPGNILNIPQGSPNGEHSLHQISPVMLSTSAPQALASNGSDANLEAQKGYGGVISYSVSSTPSSFTDTGIDSFSSYSDFTSTEPSSNNSSGNGSDAFTNFETGFTNFYGDTSPYGSTASPFMDGGVDMSHGSDLNDLMSQFLAVEDDVVLTA